MAVAVLNEHENGVAALVHAVTQVEPALGLYS